MIIQVFSNSMTFPSMELSLVIFQVFHDFQSLWEPWIGNVYQVNMQQCGKRHMLLISMGTIPGSDNSEIN